MSAQENPLAPLIETVDEVKPSISDIIDNTETEMFLKKERQVFVNKLNSIVEDQVESISDEDEIDVAMVGTVLREAISEVLTVIEGNGKKNPGYYLVPKTKDTVDSENMSISVGLSSLFESIND